MAAFAVVEGLRAGAEVERVQFLLPPENLGALHVEERSPVEANDVHDSREPFKVFLERLHKTHDERLAGGIGALVGTARVGEEIREEVVAQLEVVVDLGEGSERLLGLGAVALLGPGPGAHRLVLSEHRLQALLEVPVEVVHDAQADLLDRVELLLGCTGGEYFSKPL